MNEIEALRHGLDQVIDDINADPQGTAYVVTKDGRPAAVILDHDEWNRLVDLAAFTMIR